MEDLVQHLYVHIPFCPKKCGYCAFVTHVGSLKLMEPYLDAVRRELIAQTERYPAGPLQSVYFGGGTPSMMSPGQVADLLEAAARRLALSPDCEVTLEAHPGTVTEVSLAGYKRAGITRISFGAESLDNAELAAVGRDHSAGRVAEVVLLSRRAGFDSINLDLMYGLPGQTVESWRRTLHAAIQLHPQHLSLYPLMIEARTPFGRMRREGGMALPLDETVAGMYADACGLLSAAGYEHYEIANWALPGHRCRHNLAYWLNRSYFGVGVGAHGSAGDRRWENVSGTRRYIDLVRAGQSVSKNEEVLDDEINRVETIMLRTRLLADGLSFSDVGRRFGRHAAEKLRRQAASLQGSELLVMTENGIKIPEASALLGNEIWQALI